MGKQNDQFKPYSTLGFESKMQFKTKQIKTKQIKINSNIQVQMKNTTEQ
jgi:hypothetical protein